jgi:adhesin/invasin
MKNHGRAIVAALLVAGALAGCTSDTTTTSSCGLGPGCASGGSLGSTGGTTTGGTTTGGTTTGGTTTGGTTTGGTTTGGTPPPNPAGGIQFISATPASIGVQGSGQPTTSAVVFNVTDATGAVAPGATVNFNMSGPSGGTYIGTPNDGTPNTASGVTDGSGNVSVILNSGNVAGPVTISATVSAGAASFTAASSVISIGGAVPSASHLSISASLLNLPGFVLDNFQSTVLVLVADRFTNSTILAGTVVQFYTEAGAIGASAVLDSTGKGTVILRTQNPRPQDLPPLGPPGNATDGLDRVIAVVRGEEAFVDVNGNGVYDLGEPFTDAPSEPFIDANDNGVFDPGEFYVDTNGNGVFDGPNGVWDGPGCPQAGCITSPTIWVSMNTLWTGHLVNCSFTPPSFGPVGANATQNFIFSVSDGNGNRPVGGTTVGFAVTGGGALAGLANFTVPDSNVAGPYVVGVTLNNTNASGAPVGSTVSATITPPGGTGVTVGGTCISPTTSGTLN